MTAGHDGSAARVSVVVISKDEASLSQTLEVLQGQCQAIGAECVVVDASGGRLDWVRAAHPWVRWHDYVGPRDRAITIPHQRNVAVQIAGGDVIASCDAGGYPGPGWLSHLTSPILEGDASATAGPVRSLGDSDYGTLNDLPRGEAVRHVITCNLAFTRTLFDRVGGFDERFDYGEDVAFGWSIEEAGERVASVPDAVVTMDWGGRRRQLRRDMRYGQAKARQFLLRPAQRRKILTDNPEVVVYPAICVVGPVAILVGLLARRRGPLVLWATGAAMLLVQDRKGGRSSGAMLGHVAFSIGICHELLRASLARRPRVHIS